MDANNYIKMAVAFIVMALVAVSVVLPIMNAGAQTEKTFDNTADSIAYFDKVGADDSITFVWDYTNPTQATINGAQVDLPDPTDYYYGISILASEGFSIRYYVSGSDYILQSLGGGQASGYYGNASIVSTSNLNLTITSTTITNNTSNKAFTTTGNTYVISDSGDYVMKNPDAAAYVLDDSETLAIGLTVISGSFVIMGWDSDVGADVEPVVYYPPTGYTISGLEITSAEVNGYDNLSIFSKVDYVVTLDSDTTVNRAVTYSYFIVPASVTAEITNHPAGVELTIIQMLPVLFLVGVLLFTVSMFISNRRA